MPQACQQRGPINFDGQDLVDEPNKKDWPRSSQGPYMKGGPYYQFPLPRIYNMGRSFFLFFFGISLTIHPCLFSIFTLGEWEFKHKISVANVIDFNYEL